MNGEEIKKNRKELGITQKELALRVGVSTQTINGYENGKEIPSTKHQILDKILNQKSSLYEDTKTETEYENISVFDKKLEETKNTIEELKINLSFLPENHPDRKFIKTTIKIYEDRIKFINIAKENHLK